MKLKLSIVVVLTCLSVSSCKTVQDMKMSDIQMPDITHLFQFGNTAKKAPDQDKNLITEPTVDISSPPLKCKVYDGTAYIQKDWYRYQKASFNIRKNQTGLFSVYNKSGESHSKIQVRFDQDGQKLVFCPAALINGDNKILCTSIYALEDDFITGIKRTLDISNALRGGTMECKMLQ